MKTYRKIDIYVACGGTFKYHCSTAQSKTLKEAKSKFWNTHNGLTPELASMHIDSIKCSFAKVKS